MVLFWNKYYLLNLDLACLQSPRRKWTFKNSGCFGFVEAISILSFTACLQFTAVSTVHLYFLEEACQWKIQSPKMISTFLRFVHVHILVIFTSRVVFSVFPIFQSTLQFVSAGVCSICCIYSEEACDWKKRNPKMPRTTKKSSHMMNNSKYQEDSRIHEESWISEQE